ncbi:MAG: hypothetical protein ACJ759_16570, partial [Thermoanaerobaculia bacterium]
MEDTELERFLSAIREGLADAEAGRVIDDEELGAFLDEQFGPLDSETTIEPGEMYVPTRHDEHKHGPREPRRGGGIKPGASAHTVTHILAVSSEPRQGRRHVAPGFSPG